MQHCNNIATVALDPTFHCVLWTKFWFDVDLECGFISVRTASPWVIARVVDNFGTD